MPLLYSDPDSQPDLEANHSPPSKMDIFPGASGFAIGIFNAVQGGSTITLLSHTIPKVIRPTLL
jgi:hypothetical protein